MLCTFSPVAESDLEEIGDYIARDNPRRALSFIQEIRERCQKITDFPEAAQVRPEYGEQVRVVPIGQYLIFYTVQPAEVRIERILSGWRNLPDVLQ
jgi:plasmid stabilization system protein ParE